MTAILSFALVAAPASTPFLPDLEARMRPSDSTPWTILFTLTLITLLPAILMCMTPLVRLMVVFHFLRQALGTQTAPSNPTLLGLGLMMSWFLMTPVLNQVDQQAVEPFRAGQITGWVAIDRGSEPIKRFLLQYAREKDLALFTAAGQLPRPNTPGRSAYARGGAGLHSLRIEGRLCDRRGPVSAISAYRYGHRGDYHLDRNVSVAAGRRFHAAQDSAVRDGGWLEPAGQIPVEKFLRGMP